MASTGQLYHLAQLLKAVFPVKLEVAFSPVTYSWMDYNGQEIPIQNPYTGEVNWREVEASYKLNQRFNFSHENNDVYIVFLLKQISNFDANDFIYFFTDLHAKVVKEINSLTEDNCTFNDLYSIQRIIDEERGKIRGWEFSLDGIAYRVEYCKSHKTIPLELQIGDLSTNIAEHLTGTYEKEHKEIVRILDDIYRRIKEKMLVIPNVRVTAFRKLIWEEKQKSFDAIEKALIDSGRLLPDGTIKMSKKESIAYLYTLAEHGFIKSRLHKDTYLSYRKKVRLAFEEHYRIAALEEQFKPAKYQSMQMNSTLLDIPIEHLGTKTDHNPVLDK